MSGVCDYIPLLEHYGKPLRDRIKDPSVTAGVSNCFRQGGEAIAAGRNSMVHGTKKNYLLVRRDSELHTSSPDMDMYDVSGVHGNPSLGKPGEELWAVYSRPNKDTILYKKSEDRLPNIFHNGPGTPIVVTPGDSAAYVQIAKDYPFIVWEDHDGSAIKVYYSRMNKDGTWLTPKRVTNFDLNIYERYPRVAVDPASNKAHII